MWTKLKEFFTTDRGEIVLHSIIALVLALLMDWMMDGYWELVGTAAIIAGFTIWELAQHNWRFGEMGAQSWKELLFPAVIVLIIYVL